MIGLVKRKKNPQTQQIFTTALVICFSSPQPYNVGLVQEYSFSVYLTDLMVVWWIMSMCPAVLIIVTFLVGTSSKPRLKLRFLILVRTILYMCTKKNSSAGMTIFTNTNQMFSYMKLFFVGQKKPLWESLWKGTGHLYLQNRTMLLNFYHKQLEGNVVWFFSYIQSFIKSYCFLV